MSWELHQPAAFHPRSETDLAMAYAEKLRAVLRANGLEVPRFPRMVWAEVELPDGRALAVGIAEAEDGPVAYLCAADRVQFDRARDVVVQGQAVEGPGRVLGTLHWF
jgi:hypothetical protein